MFLMYVFASLPFVYVFSFIPKSAVMGFTNFFILNVILCVIDAVLASFPVFSSQDAKTSGPTQTYTVINIIRSIVAFFLPTVNLKHALANILLHDNTQCIRTSNAILGTSFSINEAWMSTNKPGVGTEFIFFCVQTLFWFVILIIIESRLRIEQAWRRCCRSKDSESTDQWDDSV
jgi:hypothetical protein